MVNTMVYTLQLNDYELANLRALFEACRIDVFNNPLSAINNGDWQGQIFNKLPITDTKPNRTPREIVEDVMRATI